MTVLFILIGPQPEFLGLGISLHNDALGLTLLLRIQSGYSEAAKPELGLDTEQALRTPDQGGVQRQVHITTLDELDYIVFLSLILKLQCIFKVKGCLGVIVDLELDLIADLGDDIHLYLFFKIKISLPSLTGIQHGVIPAV